MSRSTFSMKQLDHLSVYVTRKNLERATIVVILLCVLCMFMGRIPSKQTLTYNDGKMVYKGYVLNNRMNGQGKLTFENGDTYEGKFVNGVFEGHGTFISKSGWTYVGEFKKGVADGQGKLTTEANIVYEGKFKQGIYQDAN